MRRFVRLFAVVLVLLLAIPTFSMSGQNSGGDQDADVAESTGELTLGIPISVPKGTGGFQPELGLSYSSLGGDSEFGVGWSLGLGEVRRTLRFGTPTYTNIDQFELNGELLIYASVSNDVERYHSITESFAKIERMTANHGTFPNSWLVTFPDGTKARYGTRADALVDHDAGSEGTFRWLLAEMEDVNGNVVRFEYDALTDPGTRYPDKVTYSYRSGSLVGGLAREVKFLYETRPDEMVLFQGDVESRMTQRVHEIQSTVGGAPFRRLALRYAAPGAYGTDRSRLEIAQIFGTDCALSVLDPMVPGACTGLPPQTFTHFDPSDVVGGGASANWADNSAAWTVPVALAAGTGSNKGKDQGVRFADINADGHVDMVMAYRAPSGTHTKRVHLGNGAGWDATSDTEWESSLAGLQFTGQEITLFNYDLASGRFKSVAADNLSTRVSFSDLYSLGWVTQAGANVVTRIPVNMKLIDLNDDGAADIVYSYEVGEGKYGPNNIYLGPEATVRVAFRNTIHEGAKGWVLDPSLAAGIPIMNSLQYRLFVGPGNGIVNFADHDVRFANLNGDGRIDMIQGGGSAFFYDEAQAQWLAGAVEFNSPMVFSVPFTTCTTDCRQYDTGVRIVDINGDGLDDLIKTKSDSVVSQIPLPEFQVFLEDGVWLNTGTGWCGPVTCAAEQTRYTPPAGFMFLSTADMKNVASVGDVNGDGLPDLIRADGIANVRDTWIMDSAAPGGSVWVRDARFDPPATFSFLANSNGVYWPGTAAVDANSDGVLDLIQRYGASPSGVLGSLSAFSDRLRETENGQGTTVAFEYMTAPQQYDAALETLAATHGETEEPLIDTDGPDGTDLDPTILRWQANPVVTRITISGADISTQVTELAYTHPRWCPVVKSRLGYRLVDSRKSDGSTDRVFFWQRHGRAGQPHLQQTLDDVANILSEAETIWQVVDGGTVLGSVPGTHVGRLTASTQAAFYGGFEGARQTRTFTYDDAGVGYNFVTLEVVVRPSGGVVIERTRFGLSAWIQGLVATEEVSWAGVVYSGVTNSYNAKGQLTQVDRDNQDRSASPTPGLEITTSTTFDEFGNPSSKTDAGTRTINFCYDGSTTGGCPTSSTATQTLLTAVIDPLTGVTRFEGDLGTGTALKTTRHNGDIVRLELDAFGRSEASYMQPFGGTETQTEYRVYTDGSGGSRQIFTYIDATSSDTIRKAEYFDSLGRVLRRVSDNGDGGWVGTANAYDGLGRAFKSTYPSVCLDAQCSNLDALTASPVTTRQYDLLGRVTSTTDAAGTSLAYYGTSTRQGMTLDRVLSKSHVGQLRQELVDGKRTVYVDECHGTVSPGTTSLQGGECGSADQTYYVYEATGEIGTIFDAVATSTLNFNDSRHYVRYTYDTVGRTLTSWDPDGGLSETTYYQTGKVHTQKNARGQVSTFEYDDLDRVTKVTEPERTVDFAYDPVTRKRASEAQVGGAYSKAYSYDAYGRLDRETLNILGRTFHTDYQYDFLDRVHEINYPVSGLRVGYSYSGPRLTGVCELNPSNDCIAYGEHVSGTSVDALGRIVQVDMKPGTLTYDFHPAGSEYQRLKKIGFSAAGANLIDVTYSYDEAGNITGIADAHDNVATDGFDSTATYAYDHRGRLASWTEASTASTRYFSYDTLGNLTGRDLVSAGAAANQVYDATKPHAIVSSPLGGAYAYDDDGNMTTRAWAGQAQEIEFDSANRITCVGDTTDPCATSRFFYSADGARLYEDNGTTQRIFVGDTLTWNTAEGSAVGHVFAFGRRIADVERASAGLRTGWAPPGWHVPTIPPVVPWALVSALSVVGLWLLWSSGVLTTLAHRPVAATLALTLVYALAVPIPASGTPPPGGNVSRRWFLSDHLGTGTLVVNAAGTVVHRRLFEPFGKILNETDNPTQETDRLFTGKRFQEDSGLYDFKARFYDASIGRFISVDPIIQAPTDPQTINAYGYVRNNPMNAVDPDGRGFFSSIKKFFKKAFDIMKKIHKATFDAIKYAVKKIVKAVKYALVKSATITLAIIGAVVGAVVGFIVGGPGGALAGAGYGATWGYRLGLVVDGYKAARNGNWVGVAVSVAAFVGSLAILPSSPPVAQGGSSALNVASTSSVGVGASGGGWLQSAATYIRSVAVAEAGEIYGGVFGTIYGIGQGIAGIAKGIVTGNLGMIGRGVRGLLSALVMPRAGSHSGLGWPGTVGNVGIVPRTLTKLNGASVWHDAWVGANGFGSAAQFGWIRRAWTGSGVELGPYGQAYRVLGTVGFGFAGVAQKAAGF